VNLDLFRLLVFVTVVDRNGYSAAARRLNLSQPTVSHHITELERSCGGELLRYADRSVRLTAAGQEVYRAAVIMLPEQDRLRATLDDLRQGRPGRVRLGVRAAALHRPGDRAVLPCARGTLLSMRFGHSRREAQTVLDRELDLAYVIRWHLPTEADFEVLHDVELTFLAARDHPLAERDRVSAAEIAAAGLTGVESVFYRDVLRDFGLVGDHSVLEIDGLQARLLAAVAGGGVIATFVPRHVRAVVSDALVQLRVDSTSTVAAWLRDHTSG
jgi:DNA-binding transcriptional LysR family regulator